MPMAKKIKRWNKTSDVTPSVILAMLFLVSSALAATIVFDDSPQGYTLDVPRSDAAAGSCAGFVYIAGGTTSSTVTNAVTMYDLGGAAASNVEIDRVLPGGAVTDAGAAGCIIVGGRTGVADGFS